MTGTTLATGAAPPLPDSRLPTPDARDARYALILLTALSALPLYLTETIGAAPLLAFHLFLGATALNIAAGRGPQLLAAVVMRALAIAYVPFYLIDVVAISHSAIAASTHLVLFIAAYQPGESVRTNNAMQRLLTAALLFTASVATATHITILPFVILFAFLLLRQLMHLSHEETERMTGSRPTVEPPSSRAALFYVCVATAAGTLFFPLLPRIRNPLLPGMTGPLTNASTGLSESIDLNEARTISSDSSVVSRVWMGPDAVPFFTPLRLKGAVYERFENNRWEQGRRDFMPLENREGTTRIAVPDGFTRHASVQQRFLVGSRLLLPVGTYEVSRLGQVAEGPTRDVFSVWGSHRDSVTYDISLARGTSPLRPPRLALANYPVSPEIRAMARQIVAGETDPMRQAAAIERYLSTHFRYVADPAKIGHTMTVNQFLLHEQRGHCEYFAAGMVALMTALDVPARIAGGFYGGTLNPLTGYFIVRREDAHAWVEVWDGRAWQTFDPTPPSLRPGNTHDGFLRAYASALGDWINYFWDRHVLTFGFGDQIALAVEAIQRGQAAAQAVQRAARASLQEVASRGYAVAMAALLACGAAVLLLARRRQPLFAILASHLRRLGIEVGPSMTMSEAIEQLRRTNTEAAADLAPLIALYEAERFSATRDRQRIVDIRRALSGRRRSGGISV